MPRPRTLIEAVLVVGLATGFAMAAATDAAAQTRPPTLMELEQADVLDYDQFVQLNALRTLRGLDKDGDGYVSKEEAAAASPPPADRSGHAISFAGTDIDHDGRLSLAEIRQALANHPGIRSWYEEQDVNKDGALSIQERSAAKVTPQIRIGF
jgi:hypothetical protein